jgi:hypothetical protein
MPQTSTEVGALASAEWQVFGAIQQTRRLRLRPDRSGRAVVQSSAILIGGGPEPYVLSETPVKVKFAESPSHAVSILESGCGRRLGPA